MNYVNPNLSVEDTSKSWVRDCATGYVRELTVDNDHGVPRLQHGQLRGRREMNVFGCHGEKFEYDASWGLCVLWLVSYLVVVVRNGELPWSFWKVVGCG